MLFNSPVFIFIFVPITLLAFFLLNAAGRPLLARGWMVVTSLFFYAYWNPAYLPLLLGSLVVNYAISHFMHGQTERRPRQVLMIAGLVFNLGVLGIFKYANFFVDSFNVSFGTGFSLAKIILPLAISFFTFEQIAFIVDTFKGKTKRYNPIDYSLFVVFFPQLIAGPIMHPQEMLPQFAGKRHRFQTDDFSIGLTLFLIGLGKKVLIADTLGAFGSPVFDATLAGATPTLFEAWGGTLAFTLQLYFDFSGYSDMAIGLGRMIGVHIPLNFNSPYQARNIIDFWQRWHMSLSRWLKEYLYIPLGGNRKGTVRRYLNLMITMLLGGLWHGAGWTFVLWGGLHGIYLVINHGWRNLSKRTGLTLENRGGRFLGRALTFLAVVVGWTYFRAEDLSAANTLLAGMVGANGVSLPQQLSGVLAPVRGAIESLGMTFAGLGSFNGFGFLLIVPLLLVVWFVPNPQRWMAWTKPTYQAIDRPSHRQWRPAPWIGVLLGIALFLIIKGFFTQAPTEFLYFNF